MATVAPDLATAQAGNFRVNPTRLVMDNEEFTILNVTNSSRQTQNFRIEIRHMAMNEEGRLEQVPDSLGSQSWMLGNFLRFGPRQFSLPPGERRLIRIATRFRDDTPDGEYRAHLSVLNIGSDEQQRGTRDEEGNIQLGLRFTQALGIPVIARKGELDIPEVNISMAEIIREEEPPTLRLRMEMQGQRSVVGKYHVIYQNEENGEEIQVGLASGSAIYADSPARFVNIPLDLSFVPDAATLEVRYVGEENGRSHTYARQSVELLAP